MIILITGGQRSGKSKFAEKYLLEKNEKDVAYIATSIIDDEEMAERVRIHKNSRPKSWRTIEAYRNFSDKIGEENYYLLECVGTMTSNIMYGFSKDLNRISTDLSTEIEDEVFCEIENLIHSIRKENKNLLIVTNEVGFSLTSDNHVGRVYTDILGRVNQRIGKIVDEAYLIVSGMEVRLK